jgi:hypothetical protein
MKTLVFEIWKKLGIPPEVNEKKIIFEMKIFPLKFENKCLYHQRELKTKLIYFVYATKKKWFF